MHTVFYFISRADEYAGGGGEKNPVCSLQDFCFHSLSKSRQSLKSLLFYLFIFWINSSPNAITSHQQVSFTSPLIIFSPCAPTSASPVTTRAPAVPIVTSLNLQLCAVLNHSNWSPACDSHVIGSVSRYRHTHTHTHTKTCNWAAAAALEWMWAQHVCKCTCLQRQKHPKEPWANCIFYKNKNRRPFLAISDNHPICITFLWLYRGWNI